MATRDTIQLSRWTPARWGWVTFEVVWLLGSIAGLLRWPESGLSFWGQSIGYAACLLLMEAWLFAHRHDRLALDDDGLVFVRGGRETALAWSDIETFWLDWTKEDNALRLVAAGRTYSVGLDRLAQSIPATKRLRERIEPLWQSKLAAMAAGEVRPSKPLRERLGLAILALVVPVCLLLTWSASSTAEDRLAGGILAVLLGLVTAVVWRFDRAAPGPGAVRTWGRRLALERVETITIQRPKFGGERWQLRGRGVSGVIGPCVDFPLVVEHVLRSCPHAAVQYRIRKPRTDLEAIFLPVPTGGGEEFGSTTPSAVVEDRQRLLRLTGVGCWGDRGDRLRGRLRSVGQPPCPEPGTLGPEYRDGAGPSQGGRAAVAGAVRGRQPRVHADAVPQGRTQAELAGGPNGHVALPALAAWVRPLGRPDDA